MYVCTSFIYDDWIYNVVNSYDELWMESGHEVCGVGSREGGVLHR